MTPQAAFELRHAPRKWADVAQGVQNIWLAAWEMSMATHALEERKRCAKLCVDWAQTCEWGRRHGAKVGALECAKLIRTDPPLYSA